MSSFSSVRPTTTTVRDLWMILLIFLAISRKTAATGQCARAASTMFSYRFLDNRVVPNRKTADLKDCFNLCRKMSECRSLNYKIDAGICELNSKNHFTDPQKLEEMSGYVYLAVLDIVKEPAVSSNNSNGEQTPTKSSEPKYNTCAKLKQMKPSSPSGVYELDVNGSPKHVYCDMSAYGGGWALVVSISSSNNHHTLRAKNNCFNSSLCVSFATGTLVARKNSDTDIRALASYEGTFRVDVFNSAGSLLHTNFYRFPQGAQSFDAGCAGRGCPRIITSSAYPYVWQSNCKGLEKGYAISYNNCYKVFDDHDAQECGSNWIASHYHTRRVLYSLCGHNGIYSGLQGKMYVR